MIETPPRTPLLASTRPKAAVPRAAMAAMAEPVFLKNSVHTTPKNSFFRSQRPFKPACVTSIYEERISLPVLSTCSPSCRSHRE
jgi:hypothetical protein